MRVRVAVYLVFAALGVATALYYGLPYWTAPGASFAGFRALAFANAPAATLGSDIALCYLLANGWIVVEGRRLAMRGLWVYLLLNTGVAVVVGLALFLAARERALHRGAGEPAG